MSFWTYRHLAAVTNGRWLVEPDELGAQVTGLWHDTREIKQGQAYLAIKGDNFDGHDFVDKAFAAGAQLAIVSTEPATSHQPPAPLLKVDDTVNALQDLARAYRDELNQGGCKVIGIAGSNGKTTTRHLIHHVLTHAGLKGTQSPKSFNNHLGVPLTLLQAKPTDDFVAAEIGTNYPGEIDFLSAIARPDIAVITSIGEEHLEFFKDIEGVAKEELSIVDYLQNDGSVVIGDLDVTAYWPKQLKRWIKKRIAGRRIRRKKIIPARDLPHFIGKHNASNASIAVAIAKYLGISNQTALEVLRIARPPEHRMVRIELRDRVVLIDDCYNANASSMHQALEAVATHANGRYVAILGDMYELGDQTERAHQDVGLSATYWDFGLAILIGESMCKFAPEGFVSEIKSHNFPEWSDDLPDQIAALLQPGDTVLLKASRGMRLERLIPAIERRFGAAQDDEPT